jgi:hypothetical protein
MCRNLVNDSSVVSSDHTLAQDSGIPPDTIVKAKSLAESNHTIFVCGWRYDGLIRRLFPEFLHTVELELDTQSSADSLLILGIYGPCLHKPRRRSYTLSWLANTWNGKVLLVNSENTERMKILQIPDQLFRIGMYPESNHSVYVFYVSLALDWRIQ